MKKSLKRRFVAGAMLSFLTLIVLLVGSIVLLFYHEQEQQTEQFVNFLLSEDTRPEPPQPPNWFGYQFSRPNFPARYYIIEADAYGITVSTKHMRFLQEDEELVAALAAQIIQSGELDGKAGSYRFRASYQENRSRVVLVDQTMQVAALYSVIRTGVAVGAACLIVLFIILQPVAGYVVDEWMRRNEQQKQFITNAGHELKTPVAIIMSNTDALELMEGESKYSRNIHQQTVRLDRLIRQLLMIARVDELRFREQMKKLDFSSLVEECLPAYDTPVAERGMVLEKQIEASLFLRGHRESMRQMIELLLDNALQHGDENGCIRLELFRTNHQLHLIITNPVEKLPDCDPVQLFERFYRADKAHTQSHAAGCGIGLSAAQTIAHLHRGSIAITYPEEKTFRVTVILPAKN